LNTKNADEAVIKTKLFIVIRLDGSNYYYT